MKCKECPALKLDSYHCLLVFPFKPKQLLELLAGNEEDTCGMWESWEVFNEETKKQNVSS